MRFFRKRAIFIITLVMLVLCFIAVSVSINIFAYQFKKQDNINKDKPLQTSKKTYSNGKVVNGSRLSEITLYFNGSGYDGLKAYASRDHEVFLPVDAVFQKVGATFQYFQPDNVFKGEVNGQKIVLKLGDSSFTLNEKQIVLEIAPITAFGHILVPVKLFNHISCFKAENNADGSMAFLNYFKGSGSNQPDMKVLRFANGKLSISDISGLNSFWSGNGGRQNNDSVELSPEGKVLLFKSGDKLYTRQYGSKADIKIQQADPSAVLSANGQYLFWNEKNKNTSFVYNIKNQDVWELGDYCFRIGEGQAYKDTMPKVPYVDNKILYDYVVTDSFKRIALKDTKSGDIYVFIDKNGSTVVEGKALFSPDKKRIIYFKGSECYTSYADGTSPVYLGRSRNVKWVSNRKIFMTRGKDMFVFSWDNKISLKVAVQYSFAGKTVRGGVFYSAGKSLYFEADGVGSKIIDLPWTCDYVLGASSAGPLIAASTSDDCIYLINNDKLIKIGILGMLPRKDGINTAPDYENGIIYSPDGNSIMLVQNEEDVTNTYVFDKNGTLRYKAVLNCLQGSNAENRTIQTKWLSNSRILLYTIDGGWIIDISGNDGIFSWREVQGSEIKALLY